MVIHTKQNAKIHTHEPKQASIKDSNIYTVDREPTKKNTGSGNYRKSTVHHVQKEGLISKHYGRQELSDKPLDDGALASLSAMLVDDEED